MCRTGGRRCPSSRSRANGGARGRPRPAAGQQGDTPPPTGTPPPGGAGNGDTGTPPPPRGLNIVTGNATVGAQYDDIRGGIRIGPGGIVITGPATPSAPPTASQAADAEAAVARAMEAARDALRGAADAARSGHPTEGDTVNVAGDGDVIAIQIGGRTYRC